MPSLLSTVLPFLEMSDKKSPPRKEKPLFVRTPQPENKSLKRKILASESPPQDIEDKKITPKRKKTIAPQISPPLGNVTTSGITSPRTGPLSERQQMLILMRMTDENSQDSSTTKPASPQPSAVSVKRTPIDKKVHKRNERGETPLHIAAIRGDVKQIKKLIKAGADVNVADFAGWTPLHEACNRGWVHVARQLLKAGANVNVHGLENDTPLHDAVINGHEKLVELLLKHGANPLQQNSKGKSPADLTTSADMMKLLRKEIISSSSDTSSLDDVRSPASPESISSLKEEDFRTFDIEEKDLVTSRLTKSTGSFSYNSSQGPSSKRMLYPKSQESPRLTLKFHREIGDEVSDKQKEMTSYSVIMGMGEKQSLSPANSNVSSVDSDLYDPHLESKSSRLKPNEDVSSTYLNSKNNSTVIDPSLEFQSFERFNTWEPDNLDMSQNYFVKGKHKEDMPALNTQEGESDMKNNSDYIPNMADSHTNSLKAISLTSSVGYSSVNSVLSSERTNVSSNSENHSTFSKRNSISSNVVSSQDNYKNGADMDSDMSVTSTGLKWELRSSSLSCAEEDKNITLDNDQEMSPQNDQEKDSRSCSPKVPPLKIIIPPKSSSSSSSDSDSLKNLVSKAALPYVVNPGGTTVSSAVSLISSSCSQEPISSVISHPPSSTVPSKEGEISQTEDYSVDDSVVQESFDINRPKEEEKREETNQKSTRTLRSHTKEQQKLQEKPKDQEKEIPCSDDQSMQDDVSVSSKTTKADDDEQQSSLLSRKRNLRQKTETPAETPTLTLPPVSYEKPPNPFETYLAIRKQKIIFQQRSLSVVQPKPPQGFKDYLMVNCSYVLHGNSASTLSVPMLSPPNSVTEKMRDLFIEQETARYKLRLQHLTEKEKLRLALEQEKIREHGRAARASSSQNLPLSVCTLLKYDEVCNGIDSDQVEEKEKTSRSRYSGRQFLSWIKDVEDKFEKLKNALLLRHHNEAESLYAVQKMDWEWKMKECGLCDKKCVPYVEDLHVPMVQVNDEFELLFS